jgi:hypothetical protein
MIQLIDPAQKSRNAAPTNDKMSLFCRLDKPEQQNYRIDKALEDFHTIEDLMKLTKCTRARVHSHITYIEKNCYDRVKRELSGEEFRFVLKDASANVIIEGSQPTAQDISYLPTEENFESAYRTLTRPGETISIDTVLDQLENNAKKMGRSLKNNWRIITEKNIEIWSKKR